MPIGQISAEARDLIQRTEKWLAGSNPHWIKHSWAKFVKGNFEYDAQEEEELIGKNYKRRSEVDYDEYDQETEIFPWKKVEEPAGACLMGGLLVMNNYEDNQAYREAKRFLAELVRESEDFNGKSSIPPGYTSEDVIMTWNDSVSRTLGDIRHLFSLARNRLQK